MNFPSKRGRKPKPGKAASADQKKSPTRIPAIVSLEQYDFIVNGFTITVSGKAKNVHIGRASMVVNF